MSHYGELIVFTTDSGLEPRDLIVRGAAAVLAEQTGYVFIRPDATVTNVETEHSLDENDDSYVGQRLSIRDAVQHFKAGHCLEVRLRSELWRTLQPAMVAAIPESIAGDFRPGSPVLRVGWHDIEEDTTERVVFGRAWFSLALFGHGSPLNWWEYPRLAFQVPMIRELRAKVEAFAGPCEACARWSA